MTMMMMIIIMSGRRKVRENISSPWRWSGLQKASEGFDSSQTHLEKISFFFPDNEMCRVL